jgi:hypothetical protein
MIRSSVAIGRIAMPGYDDLNPHFGRPLHDRIKIVNFEPQQHSVPIWFVFTIADRTVMVFNLETVQLKDEFAI